MASCRATPSTGVMRMMSKSRVSTRVALIGALALMGAVLTAQAAQADGYNCTPGTTQSGGVVTCSSTDVGDSTSNDGDVSPDLSYSPVNGSPGLGPCTDRNGNASWIDYLYNATTGATIGPQCVTVFGGSPNPPAVSVEQVKLLIKMPKPRANFQGDFLTGANVTFNIPNAKDRFAIQIPEVPGVTVKGLPAAGEAGDYTWTFDDGHTETTKVPTVTHVYQQTSKQLGHPVVVSVSRTWDLYLLQDAADDIDAVQSFGSVLKTQSLDEKNVVQVWAAQTEPNN